MSRVPGEPMTSYISRRRRSWTLVREMDNTLELGDTVQGGMMLEQTELGGDTSADATALVAHARLDASDIPVETPPKAPPGSRRPRKPPRVIPLPPPPTPQCAGECKENSRRGTDATVECFACVDCGFVTTRCKGATEDPAMCPHTETDTRGSSKTLVRHALQSVFEGCARVASQRSHSASRNNSKRRFSIGHAPIS